MKFLKLVGGCAVVMASVLSCKKKETTINNQLNATDNNFILLAGTNNTAEIETAKVAISKSADSVILSFAHQIMSQHTTAQNDLKTMGTIVGFTVKDTLDAAHAAVISHLDTLAGKAFDSTYIHTRLINNQDVTTFYSEEIANGQQTNVRAYAKSNLEIIKLEYQRADSIATAFY